MARKASKSAERIGFSWPVRVQLNPVRHSEASSHDAGGVASEGTGSCRAGFMQLGAWGPRGSSSSTKSCKKGQFRKVFLCFKRGRAEAQGRTYTHLSHTKPFLVIAASFHQLGLTLLTLA